MSAILRLDMHVHTDASPDSTLTVPRALEEAKAKGLDGIAITDHNTMSAVATAVALGEKLGLKVVPGVEVSTQEGHLLAYFVPEPPAPGRSITLTAQEIHEKGGFAVLAHPYRFFHGAARSGSLDLAAFDGIEVRNAHTSRGRNIRAEHLSRPGRSFGGSDAHGPGTLGAYFSEIEGTGSDLKDLLNGSSVKAQGIGLSLGQLTAIGAGNLFRRVRRGFRPI
ncbi:MAG: PHP domain-containing protein [Candidatus Thermoplasmatota archaeon]|jgi:predicted metal-dependent phosphoesterase TrpH|nr:PHP domain-containing protein [Candidatus Thermoplasmatota archaeon]